MTITGVNTRLTQSQLMIWMGQKLNPRAPLYNMALAFELNGVIELNHFEKSFQRLIDCNDSLRTVFSVEPEIPFQQVLSDFRYTIETIDWSSNLKKEEDIQSWLTDRSQKQFDLTQPPFDSVLIRLATDKYIWYFNQHHLITDGWSVTVLYKKMIELYEASLKGELTTTELAPPYSRYQLVEEQEREKSQNEEEN